MKILIMTVTWCVQQKGKAARGDIRAAVDKEKGKARQKTRWFFRF
jgi:hypothetical protein